MEARKRDYLSIDVHQRLDVLSDSEWQQFFPGFPDSLELIQHLQKVGMDQFNFHSILVRDAGRPILMLPLFETQYDVFSGYHGAGKTILNYIAKCLPRLFNPRMVGVGFVEGEWGQIGWDRSSSREKLRTAWRLAMEALNAMQLGLAADLIAFIDFNEESGSIISMGNMKGYAQMASYPCAMLPIHYSSLEDYLNSLSKGTRKNLKRKRKKAEKFSVMHTTDPENWIDEIYNFYQQTVQRSDVAFGIQRMEYFRDICKEVPGAQYALYFADEKLIAFNLLIHTKEKLVDKYFGMDPIIGREFNLYFLSWLENIETCIQNKIPVYHAGPAAEGLKARLAAQFIPAVILFKHRNPLAQTVLRILAPYLGTQLEIELEIAHLGKFWEEFAPIPTLESYINAPILQTEGSVQVRV